MWAWKHPHGDGSITYTKAVSYTPLAVYKRQPLAGEIVFGEGLGKNSIGSLPQQELSRRDFPASVREVVQSGCVAGAPYRPFYTKAQKMRAADSMARMGISDIADESFCRLSGGQKQRALLARCV